ncbi:hypothetical protein [Polyangium aurulentum]|uniref:hypothetical protein n=1 Tax=Polyangium aurulentum TaxID=2567896 RepID=UPI00146B6896|nr:hypothetical protein [Polyangium aurulentum]UQA62981.1 hypothetical protein E8A73_021990 [Polyangium aurulentum]
MHRSWISSSILFTTILLASTGCELITAVDPDLLDQGAGGTGGQGGTGGMGGNGGAGGMGQGGGGGPAQCQTASDCGTDTECDAWTCDQNVCGHKYAPQGKLTSKQIEGDCARNACNGTGSEILIVFDGDKPNDNNECTVDDCSNGAPVYTNVVAGSVCTQNGGKFCNDMGACVACTVDAHCTVDQTCSPMGTCVP